MCSLCMGVASGPPKLNIWSEPRHRSHNSVDTQWQGVVCISSYQWTVFRNPWNHAFDVSNNLVRWLIAFWDFDPKMWYTAFGGVWRNESSTAQFIKILSLNHLFLNQEIGVRCSGFCFCWAFKPAAVTLSFCICSKAGYYYFLKGNLFLTLKYPRKWLSGGWLVVFAWFVRVFLMLFSLPYFG